MYAFVDRPLRGLDRGSQMLVWAMRNWVQSMTERCCPGHALAPVFAGMAVLAGLQPFMQMMALLNRHALEMFHFCAVRCDHVSEHEALILSLQCRMHATNAMRDTLALLVEDDAVGAVFDAMIRLGAALESANLRPRQIAVAVPPTARPDHA